MGMHPLNKINDHGVLWNVLFGDDREDQLNKMCDLGLIDHSHISKWRNFLQPLTPKSREWANTIDDLFFKTSKILENNSYISTKSPRDIASNLLRAANIFDDKINLIENLRGKIFLDVGSGVYRTFNVSMILYCNGVDKAFAFEPYPLKTDFVFYSYQKMIEHMSNCPEDFIFSGISIDEFIGRLKTFIIPNSFKKIKELNDNPNGILNIGGVTFFRNLLDVPRNSVNIHFSNAVLEHINELSNFILQLKDVVCSDSIGLHIVDFLDHRHYNDSTISPVEKYFDGILDEINGFTPSELEEILISADWNIKKYEALHIPDSYILLDSRKKVDRYSTKPLKDLNQHINFYKMTLS